MPVGVCPDCGGPQSRLVCNSPNSGAAANLSPFRRTFPAASDSILLGRTIGDRPMGAVVDPPTEAELVEAAKDGNVESFGELYRRHYAAVVGVAYCA